MSEEEMNSYRLTSLEEPGEARLQQIMREAAQQARQENLQAQERLMQDLEYAKAKAIKKWGESLNRFSK